MRILVLGGSGAIGSHVLAELASQHDSTGTYFSNHAIRVPGAPLIQLDVRDARCLQSVLRTNRPDLVIQSCGTKDIEFCQDNPSAAWQVHVEGTRHVAAACMQLGCRLAYVSTDCVFDGNKLFYTEEDVTNPFNEYGRVKHEGERIVLASGLNAIVIRASLLYGWRRPGQASNFALNVLDALSNDRPFFAAPNLFNTPMEITCAARAIAAAAVSTHQGRLHLAGKDRVSRYDFALEAAHAFALDTTRLHSRNDVSGLRQPNSCLDVTKAETLLHLRFEGLRAGLKRMSEQRSTLNLEDNR